MSHRGDLATAEPAQRRVESREGCVAPVARGHEALDESPNVLGLRAAGRALTRLSRGGARSVAAEEHPQTDGHREDQHNSDDDRGPAWPPCIGGRAGGCRGRCRRRNVRGRDRSDALRRDGPRFSRHGDRLPRRLAYGSAWLRNLRPPGSGGRGQRIQQRRTQRPVCGEVQLSVVVILRQRTKSLRNIDTHGISRSTRNPVMASPVSGCDRFASAVQEDRLSL